MKVTQKTYKTNLFGTHVYMSRDWSENLNQKIQRFAKVEFLINFDFRFNTLNTKSNHTGEVTFLGTQSEKFPAFKN